jgi:transcriptional regulator with XRE-family HTH domain
MAMQLKRYIGMRAREARQRQGLTQADVAERIGKSVETVSNTERGVTWPSLEMLEAFARAVECPIAEFFEGYGEAAGSTKRLQLESDVRIALGALRDADVTVALHLIRALAAARQEP